MQIVREQRYHGNGFYREYGKKPVFSKKRSNLSKISMVTENFFQH